MCQLHSVSGSAALGCHGFSTSAHGMARESEGLHIAPSGSSISTAAPAESSRGRHSRLTRGPLWRPTVAKLRSKVAGKWSLHGPASDASARVWYRRTRMHGHCTCGRACTASADGGSDTLQVFFTLKWAPKIPAGTNLGLMIGVSTPLSPYPTAQASKWINR